MNFVSRWNVCKGGTIIMSMPIAYGLSNRNLYIGCLHLVLILIDLMGYMGFLTSTTIFLYCVI